MVFGYKEKLCNRQWPEISLTKHEPKALIDPTFSGQWLGPDQRGSTEKNMAQVKANDIRRGMVVVIEGVNFVVMDFLHHTPGNLRAMVQTKLKSLKNGSTIEKRFRSADTLEVPYVETKEFQYLYSQGDEHVFMDMETYDQFPLNSDILGTSLKFVVPNTKVMVKYIDDKPVSVEIPASMEYVITDTAPELKGATATNQYKEAICENGLTIQVPPFMKIGDKVKVDTRTGEYLERVK